MSYLKNIAEFNSGSTSARYFSALSGHISAIIISISGIAFAGRISIDII